MKNIICLLWFYTLVSITPAHTQETIHVDLQTFEPLTHVYIREIESQNTSHSLEYLHELKKILTFDFTHNGKTQVIENSSDLEAFTNPQTLPTHPSFDPLIAQDIEWVITPHLRQNQLTIELFSPLERKTHTLKGIEVRGQLPVDRKTIHQLSDTLFFHLFGIEGTAGSHIVYTRKTPQGSFLILADYDGFNEQTLVQTASLLVTPKAMYSKQSQAPSHILYVSYQEGIPKLFVFDTDQKSSQKLLHIRGNQLTPSISRDGSQIAFISDAKDNPDIFLLEFDQETFPRCIFGYPKATQSSPTFSPDGKTIAFVSNKDGATRVYTLPIPSKDVPIRSLRPKLISQQTREASAPAFSPDGQKLAYCAKNSQGYRQVWICDLNTGHEQQLTRGDIHKENPTWSKNGLQILYNTREGEESYLHLIPIHHPKSFKIRQKGQINRFPSWYS